MSKEIILYTDGGCNNNGQPNAVSGFGAHILITDKNLKHKQIDNKYVVTDHGYMSKSDFKMLNKEKSEDRLRGIEGIIELFGFNKDSKTNNQAELDAVVESLQYLLSMSSTEFINNVKDYNTITVYIDSRYTLGTIKKIEDPKFDINQIDVNKEKIMKLKNTLDKLKMINPNIKFEKIKAHTSNNIGNIRADLMANMGKLLNIRNKEDKYKLEYKFYKGSEFWSEPEIDEKLKSLLFNKYYFYYPPNLIVKNNNHYNYYGINYKEISDIGKRASDIYFNILKTKLSDKTLELVLENINFGNKLVNKPFLIEPKAIFSKQTLRDLINYGKNFIRFNPFLNNGLVLLTLDKKEIAREVYPPTMSFELVKKFKYYEEEMFIVYDLITNEGESSNFIIKDITDILFIKDKKGRQVLKKEITNDKIPVKLKLDLNNKKRTIKVLFKYDLPPRNTLKKLEKDVKVYVVLKKYDSFYRLSTLTLSPDFMLYNISVYSNLINIV